MLVSIAIMMGVRGESEKSFILNNIELVGVYSGYILAILSQITRDINRVATFEKFREETVKDLIRLGGNPEDLDKEEEMEEKKEEDKQEIRPKRRTKKEG